MDELTKLKIDLSNMRVYNKTELYPNTKSLSSSQLIYYPKDPYQFYCEWVMKMERPKSPAMCFGIAFSEAYADRSFDYVTYCLENKVNKRLIGLMAEVLPLFPALPEEDCEFELWIDHRGWKFRVTLDGFIPDDGIIIENKTGQVYWHQERVDDDLQLTIQIWAYWRKYGELPKQLLLNWVDTSAQATKKIWTFKTKRTITQLKAFEKYYLDVVIDNLEAKNFSNKVPVWEQ